MEPTEEAASDVTPTPTHTRTQFTNLGDAQIQGALKRGLSIANDLSGDHDGEPGRKRHCCLGWAGWRRVGMQMNRMWEMDDDDKLHVKGGCV